MFRLIISIFTLFFSLQSFAAIIYKHETVRGFPQYYCTGANEPFYHRLVNLIGSIQKYNYANLAEIAVFDLGLTEEMVNNLNKMRKVQVYRLRDPHPGVLENLGLYAWKPTAIKESLEMFPYVLWIDAGMTVLKSLDPLFQHIEKNGYFLSNNGDFLDGEGVPVHGVNWQTTTYLKDKFQLHTPERAWILRQDSLMAGFVGCVRDPERSHSLIDDWYALTSDLRNFTDDGTCPQGFGCGRHDQTLLSILAYLKGLKVHELDHTQNKPMILSTPKGDAPLYITHNGSALSDRTSIYLSRYDTRDFYHYYEHIRFK